MNVADEQDRVAQLVQAAFDGDNERILLLLEAGVPINAKGPGFAPLHAAIENHQPATVALLLERGADIELVAAGLTPLAHAVDAAIDGHWQTGGQPGDEPTDVISMLLAAGATAESGLEVARAYGATKIIELLTGTPPS